MRDAGSRARRSNACLNGVTSIHVSCDPSRHLAVSACKEFFYLLPNLTEIAMVGGFYSSEVLWFIASSYPKLKQLTWMRSDYKSPFENDHVADGWSSFSHLKCLTNVFFDGNRFSGCARRYGTEGGHYDAWYLLAYFCRLERLGIKNYAWAGNGQKEYGPMPQEILIKMVRRHPNLRWLRSDLSEENVAMLQQERPEITFVSDIEAFYMHTIHEFI